MTIAHLKRHTRIVTGLGGNSRLSGASFEFGFRTGEFGKTRLHADTFRLAGAHAQVPYANSFAYV